MGADTFTPKHLIFLVEQDDADVGPKPIAVKHNQTPIFKLRSLCTARAVYQGAKPAVVLMQTAKFSELRHESIPIFHFYP
jgi:hypothetical protein